MIGANVEVIELLKVWDSLVASVVKRDDFRLAKETRIIALQMYAEKMGRVEFKEYRVCMLASLRQLLPSHWDSDHQRAWEMLWDTLAGLLGASLELPQKYHRKVESVVDGLSKAEKREVGFGVFQRLFVMNP